MSISSQNSALSTSCENFANGQKTLGLVRKETTQRMFYEK